MEIPETKGFIPKGFELGTKLSEPNRSIIRFWETTHLPLPQANINFYFSLRAKCWLKGGGRLEVSQKHYFSNPINNFSSALQ